MPDADLLDERRDLLRTLYLRAIDTQDWVVLSECDRIARRCPQYAAELAETRAAARVEYGALAAIRQSAD